jgi:hypothetical protein
MIITGLLAALALSPSSGQVSGTAPVLKTATSHPIQYYLSLPENWTPKKRWPVVVVIESANRDFPQAIKTFAEARKSLPFILVVPLVVTNGGSRFREVPTYKYSDSVWSRIESDGQFKFDMDGITSIEQDVRRLYGGEDKYFLTAWEAGGHTLWALLFKHPEAVRAAAPVCPNYAGRWVDEGEISTSPERVDLPIRCFQGADDALSAPNHPIFGQWEKAKSVALRHGYKNITQERVAGKGHEPLAAEVLRYFSSFLKG